MCAMGKIIAMDTTQAVTVDTLIDEFAREHRYIPSEAVVVQNSEELPLRLQARIKGRPMDAVWRAWCEGVRAWLIIGRRVFDSRASAQDVVLEMSFHDESGVCVATGAWLRRSDGKWLLHRVPADPFPSDENLPGWRAGTK